MFKKEKKARYVMAEKMMSMKMDAPMSFNKDFYKDLEAEESKK